MPPPGSRKPKELVAPPVFVRILPRNVGGHVEDGNKNNVAKRLKDWRGSNTDGDGTKTKDNKPCVILSDTHGDTMYGFPKDVFGPGATNADIFTNVAAPLLHKFLDADDPHSVILFAYGQTGTGKTHTLMGPEVSWDTVDHSEWGVFPRIVSEVLRVMETRQGNCAYATHVSAVEFYFCQGFCLLDGKKQVLVRDGEIVGKKQVKVERAEDVLRVLANVRNTRTTASTKMNPALMSSMGKQSGSKNNTAHGGSSRSHCALTLRLSMVDKQ